MPQQFFIFLTFEGKAEDAMNFHVSLFKDASIVGIKRYGAGELGKEGSVMHAQFTLGMQHSMCIDSPGKHDFTFTPATPIFVVCDAEAEAEALFARRTGIHTARREIWLALGQIRRVLTDQLHAASSGVM